MRAQCRVEFLSASNRPELFVLITPLHLTPNLNVVQTWISVSNIHPLKQNPSVCKFADVYFHSLPTGFSCLYLIYKYVLPVFYLLSPVLQEEEIKVATQVNEVMPVQQEFKSEKARAITKDERHFNAYIALRQARATKRSVNMFILNSIDGLVTW